LLSPYLPAMINQQACPNYIPTVALAQATMPAAPLSSLRPVPVGEKHRDGGLALQRLSDLT